LAANATASISTCSSGQAASAMAIFSLPAMWRAMAAISSGV
jgi:hypothetical protein